MFTLFHKENLDLADPNSRLLEYGRRTLFIKNAKVTTVLRLRSGTNFFQSALVLESQSQGIDEGLKIKYRISLKVLLQKLFPPRRKYGPPAFSKILLWKLN